MKEGVDLALKHNLNQQIIDVIQQHHGTSLVYYFYKRALQQQEDARAGGKIMNMREDDIPEVREESFRYSGPKPQTKESAIISLADMVESASRSLEKPTPQKIEQFVTELIAQRIADRQLDECDLTLAELTNHRRALSFHPDDDAAHAYRLSETGHEDRSRRGRCPAPGRDGRDKKPASAPPVSAA